MFRIRTPQLSPEDRDPRVPDESPPVDLSVSLLRAEAPDGGAVNGKSAQSRKRYRVYVFGRRDTPRRA